MSARPRLLIITPDFPPSPGGIQVMTQRLARYIDGFHTRVVTLDCDGSAPFDAANAGYGVRRVGAARLPRGARSGLLNAVAVRDALAARPDVTLSMHIVTSPAASAIHRVLGVPTVQYFHAEEIGARARLAAFAVREADTAIAVSAYTAGLIAGTGAEPARTRLIPPGVDIPDDASALANDRPTILTVARMEERYKGHDVLVRALPLVLAKVPAAQWVVIGDGSLRAGIEGLAHAYGVSEAVRFLGAVSDVERDSWFRRADLLAMPSRLPGGGFAGEGFGIVFLEAGAYGKPVVAGNVGGALDSVSDGESGLLIDPLDSLALAEAITRLLLDPELARRLGGAGRERARSFAWPAIAARVQSALRELLPG